MKKLYLSLTFIMILFSLQATNSLTKEELQIMPLEMRIKTKGEQNQQNFIPVDKKGLPLTQSGIKGKTAYGFLIYDPSVSGQGITSFDISKAGAITMEFYSELISCAGAYANGNYYTFLGYSQGGYVMPVSLSIVDLRTGAVSEVANYSTWQMLYADMSYDYSTSTMFGLGSVATSATSKVSTLITIDLKTGAYTTLFDLDRQFYTLACSYDGQIYAIDKNGMCCKINKTTGEITETGSTGESPKFMQSMEFDHTDNTLYWTGSNASGEGFLSKVNTSTGNSSRVGTLGISAEITGLYIPFDLPQSNAPGKVTDFTITPDPNGTLKALLSWKNPTITFSGQSLTEITKIDIYRNNEIIHTINTPTVGSTLTWTDNNSIQGLVTYKIIAVNKIGNGMGSEITKFIGHDVPGKATGITAENIGNTVHLNWTAPSAGKYGGYIDKNSLKYTLKRMPDNITVAQNITNTNYIDKSVTAAGRYYYEILTSNTDGEGLTAESNSVVAGLAATLPYSCNFGTEEEFNMWTVINGNNDERTWERKSKNGQWWVEYMYHKTNIADDYIITPPIKLETGKNYKVEFDLKAALAERVKVTAGKGSIASTQTITIGDFKDIIKKEFETMKLELTVPETGDYNIGIYCYSEPNKHWVYITNVNISVYSDNDLSALSVSGKYLPVQGKKYNYKVQIKNEGRLTQNNFTLQLIDNQENVLCSSAITESIEPQQIKDINIEWQPATSGEMQIRGKVVLNGDSFTLNDTSQPFTVKVEPTGSSDWSEIGIAEKQSTVQPIVFMAKNGAVQNIYPANEIAIPDGGLIEKIFYEYDNQSGKEIKDKPLKIYMANTELISLAEAWIPAAELTLVYDGTISLEAGKNNIIIPLDCAFLYNGGNLCIMTDRAKDNLYYSKVNFNTTTDNVQKGRTRRYSSDSTPFDFTQAGYIVDDVADIKIAIKNGINLDNELTALSITGNILPVKGKTYNYDIKIKNNGRATQNTFTVKIIDDNNTVLSEKNISEPLISGETKIITLPWTPSTAGIMGIKGYVVLESDIYQENNISKRNEITVQPEGSPEWSIIGENTTNEKTQPINFYFKAGTVQTIYTTAEIGPEGGMIEKLNYKYINLSNKEITDKPIKIYIAETSLTTLKNGWIPMDQFKLVYEGNVSLVIGEAMLEFTLNTPFLYTTGKNICIMTERVKDDAYFNNVNFYFTKDTQLPARNRNYGNDTTPFDFTQEGKTSDNVSDIRIAIQQNGGSSLTGKITNGETPLDAVTIEIKSLNIKTISDNTGNYRIGYLPSGKYTLNISKIGFHDKEIKDVTIIAGTPSVLHITLDKIMEFKVSGNVIDADEIALEGAKAIITGYNTYETTTLQDGTFEFPMVYAAKNYTLTIKKKGLAPAVITFDMEEQDKELGAIKMEDELASVVNLKAQTEGTSAVLNWIDGTGTKIFRNDDGTAVSGLGTSTGTEKTVLGAVYREPSTLYNMSWMTISQGGPHTSVNIFVFDLNSSGLPTSTILYSKTEVPNTDTQWMTYMFESPVNAPNGFMLAISYKGFASLGIDSGTNPEYPFKENTNFICSDYTTGKFTTIESQKFTQNFLIRAQGSTTGQDKSLKGYMVYRLQKGQETSTDSWQLLTETKISQNTFTDSGYGQLAQGQYRYAVKAVYSNDKYSESSLSNILAKDMETKVTVNINTNTLENETEGASVTLSDNSGHYYEGKADNIGKIVFNNVWKGTYNIKIKLNGFNEFEKKAENLSTEPEYVIGPFTLIETIVNPDNLQILNTDERTVKIFNWNVSNNMTETFDTHQDFAINSTGKIGWTYMDIDDQTTFGIKNYVFPNQGSKMAYIIFNPSQTTPSMNPEQATAIKPHSGSKFLASFAASQTQNNDWIISPRLNFQRNFTFKFYGKSYTKTYIEQINVYYSTTTNQTNDFKLLNQTPIDVPAENWTEYKYDIPKEATYVAIQCVSNDKFIMMIDDIFIGTEPSRKFKEYQVWLDGNMILKTNDLTYTFRDLADGKHTAGVKSIYTSGTSTLQIKEFTVEKEIIEYVVNITPAQHGTITVKDSKTIINDKDKVKEGTVLEIIATPDEQYQLDAIRVNSNIIEGNHYTVSGNTSITASFIPVGVDNKENDLYNIYTYDKNIYINIKTQQDATIEIYDITGAKVKSQITSQTDNIITIDKTGLYIVTVTTQNNRIIKKVIIK